MGTPQRSTVLTRSPPETNEERKKRPRGSEIGGGEGEEDEKALLKDILRVVKDSQRENREIKAKLEQIGERFEGLEAKMKKMEERREQEISQLNNCIKKNREDLEKMAREMSLLKEEVELEKRRRVSREEWERKRNIIVKGMKEETSESGEETKKILEDFFGKKLAIQDITVEKATRLGKKLAGKSRNIKVSFANIEERQKVFTNKSKLRGTNIYLEPDYTFETRQRRQKLFRLRWEMREEGKHGYVLGDKLKIGGDLFELRENNGEEILHKIEKAKNVRSPGLEGEARGGALLII